MAILSPPCDPAGSPNRPLGRPFRPKCRLFVTLLYDPSPLETDLAPQSRPKGPKTSAGLDLTIFTPPGLHFERFLMIFGGFLVTFPTDFGRILNTFQINPVINFVVICDPIVI